MEVKSHQTLDTGCGVYTLPVAAQTEIYSKVDRGQIVGEHQDEKRKVRQDQWKGLDGFSKAFYLKNSLRFLLRNDKLELKQSEFWQQF
jgi:hypothetical protein